MPIFRKKINNEDDTTKTYIPKSINDDTTIIYTPNNAVGFDTIFENRFDLMAQIGVGSTSKIYTAVDKLLNREIALKILKPELLKHELEYESRLKTEAALYSKLEHPNIIPIYDYFETRNGPALVLRRCHKTLSELITENSLPQRQIMLLLKQIASTLDYIRSEGFSHGDIKPKNIMTDSDCTHAYLIDFGIMSNSQNAQVDRIVMGTPKYISPEAVEGERAFVFQDEDLGLSFSDTFSFGVLLYEVLSGYLPFDDSTHPKYAKTVWKDSAGLRVARGEKPIQCSERNSSVPRVVSETLADMLAREPLDRPESLVDVMNLVIDAYDGKHIYDSKVFISYSRRDDQVARLIADNLNKEGFEVWWDDLLEFGDIWDDQIEEKIMDADAMLVIVSEHSNVSKEVKLEWKYCLQYRLNLPIIPIVLDSSRLPYRLAALQRIQASRDISAQALKKILTALEGSIKSQIQREKASYRKQSSDDETRVANYAAAPTSMLDTFSLEDLTVFVPANRL